MSAHPWHKRYHSDALAGFMGLTLEQRGAYQTILDLLYDRAAPLVDNERLLAGYMGVSLRKYRAIRDQLIEMGKIYRTSDDKISNGRFDNERIRGANTSRKQAENGAKGGARKAENTKNANKNNNDPQPLPGDDFDLPDTRSQTEKREAKASPKRGRRIPDDWLVPKAWKDWACGEGLSLDQAELEACKFADYWRGVSGARGVKRDWLATWRNWVRTSLERRCMLPTNQVRSEHARSKQAISKQARSKQERISDDIAAFKRDARQNYG